MGLDHSGGIRSVISRCVDSNADLMAFAFGGRRPRYGGRGRRVFGPDDPPLGRSFPRYLGQAGHAALDVFLVEPWSILLRCLSQGKAD